MTGGIYLIENIPTGVIYVGSAKSFADRWKSHLQNLRRNKHVNIHLQRSFNKHGEQAFIFKPQEVLGDYNRELYFQKENELMDKLKAEGRKLYNIAMAQGGWSFHDDETKKRIAAKVSLGLRLTYSKMTSDERKQRYAYWSTDKHYPDDARKRISAKLTGIVRSDETKARMRDGQAPLKESKQLRMRAVGLLNIGRAPPNKGATASAETRLKQSLAKLGKRMSEEQKALRRGRPAANRKPVRVSGIEFPSMTAAAKHFNKSMTWIYNRIEYDNRQETDQENKFQE